MAKKTKNPGKFIKQCDALLDAVKTSYDGLETIDGGRTWFTRKNIGMDTVKKWSLIAVKLCKRRGYFKQPVRSKGGYKDEHQTMYLKRPF